MKIIKQWKDEDGDMITNYCEECAAGDHADYDDDIELVIVRDGEGRTIKHCQMCYEHRDWNNRKPGPAGGCNTRQKGV